MTTLPPRSVASLSTYVAIGLASGMLLCPLPAAAEPAPRATVTLGIGGKLKAGSWTPIRVELESPLADGSEVIAVTADFENNELETPLVAESPERFAGMVQVGRLEGRVKVTLRKDGNDSVLSELRVRFEGETSPASYRQSTEFWGILGSNARFADAASQWSDGRRGGGARALPAAAVAMPLGWDDLPSAVEAWDSLDVLVIGGGALKAPVEKSETLRRWVERGGRALFLLGAATDDYQGSEIAKWSPIATDGTVHATSLDMINARVPRSASLRIGLRKTVTAAKLPGPPESVLPGPAVLAKPYGFGFISAFAFDFEQEPLSNWENQPALLRQLMMPSASGPGRVARDTDLSSTGFTDLASQMISGLDRFEDVNRASFRGVMVWTALWMLVLFPLDYLLVHKVLKRPHLTWATLPFLIACATLMASRSARASNTAPLTANQIDLLDFTPARSTARVRSWMTFYSGETTRYDVSATSPFAGEARLAWNAKPEEGLRGLYRQGGINPVAPVFRSSEDHRKFEDLPVRLWSSYSIAAEASRDLSDQPPLIVSKLSESDAGRLQGEIRHHFPGPLHDWVILYKNFLYHPVPSRGELTIGEWESGSAWRPGRDGQSTLVKVYLQGHHYFRTSAKRTGDETGKVAKMDQVHLEVMPYDAEEFDPNRLMRILSFHEQAGGPAYTGLANGPLAKADLSRTLDSRTYNGIDCAVLMARLDFPAMNYSIDGAAVPPGRSWTFVRAVLPVESP